MSTPVEKMRNKSHSESITKSVTSNSTLTILVVDDDTACLAIVAALLKKFQYEVLTVKHARDALCALRVKKGYFDLVVTDVHMPDMNGFELQQIIAREFDLPVILMSVDDKEGVVLKGLDGGAAYFIAKPVCPDDVRDLWQFASMKKKSRAVIEKTDKGSFPEEEISSHKILASASSMNGDKHNNKDLDRRFPRKEGMDEKRGEKCEVYKKKSKIIWTNSLHNRFLEAIRSIGFDRAVPKKILEVMNVPGLTRENVASHLQKYRIFLKKVSDAASFQVHYSNNNDKRRLTSRSYKPSFTSSSIPYSLLNFDRFSRLHNPTPRNYPSSFISSSFTNQGASSSSSLIPQSRLFGQPRLLTNRATFPRQNFAGNATNLINQSHRALARFGQNMNYQTTTSNTFQGQLSNISLENIFSSSRNAPTENTSLTHKYVGLEISSLKRLVEHGNDKKHDGVMNVPSHPDDHEYQNNSTNVISVEGMVNDPRMNFDQLVRYLEGSNPSSPFYSVDAGNAGGKELTDVIADYQMLLPTNVENNRGESNIHQQSCHSSPLFDLSDFGISSSPLHDMEEGGVNSSLPNQLNHENQQIGGKNVPSPGFYGSPNHWANNVPPIEQALGEQKGIDHNVFSSSHELGEPSQLHTTPLPNFNEQGQKSLVNSVEFAGTSSKLKKDPISTNVREDNDFLESLLAPSPYGEDQIPEGI